MSNSSVISSIKNVTTSSIINIIVSNTTLLLLETSVLKSDLNIEKTFKYCWDKYPELFGKIKIVYTDVDVNGNVIIDNNKIIENNINYLNEYYNKGYKLFVGFSVSTILKGVLPWFETTGVDAKGISLTSSSISLKFPKPIYRLQINDNKTILSLDSILQTSNKIYYIYSEDEETSNTNINFINSLYPDKIVPFLVKSDSSNLTLDNMKELYKDVDDNSVSIMYLFINNQESNFLKLFNEEYTLQTPTYDCNISVNAEINPLSNFGIVNRYHNISNLSLSTSKLYRDCLGNLGDVFVPTVTNALLLINNLAINSNINTLSSHNSILEFDENNDIKYYTLLDQVYASKSNGDFYFDKIVYTLYDPFVKKSV